MLDKYLEAVEFAVVRHNGQFRKGKGAEPYVVHPVRVAKILAQYGLAGEVVISAALLHDVMEDCDVTYKVLTEKFGLMVANVVREVTDVGEYDSREERKLAQAEKIKTASPAAKIVKIADQFDNVRDAYLTPAKGWNHRARLDYIKSAEMVVEAAMVGLNEDFADAMYQDFKKTAVAAVAYIESLDALSPDK
jgi:(p)ppGpp synthase/HD superfamily hydrolase